MAGILKLRVERTRIKDEIRKAERAGDIDRLETLEEWLATVELAINEAFGYRKMQSKKRRVFHLTDEEYEKVKAFIEENL